MTKSSSSVADFVEALPETKSKCMWCECDVENSTPQFTIFFNIDDPQSLPFSKYSFPLTYAQIAYDNNGFLEKYPYNITACSRKCFLLMENYRGEINIDNNKRLYKKYKYL